ncbi:MAG: metal-dependent transcriptional regulator [Defluviitaleaceae bacterium]|nr:metal-dependent transcriptional regulator [Defluviitaleaceae bacterium]MCL2238982.1 metal-dependent transcriptional regulator [Defluviitaleaceae bacterium]
MKIQASAEDYLEAIWILSQKLGKVRSKDLVAHMNYAKPTISIIVKKFKDNGYITIEDERYITLTEKGAEIAQRIHQRHVLLSQVLIALGVNEKQAYEDACKIEHAISEESYTCIKAHFEKWVPPTGDATKSQ